MTKEQFDTLSNEMQEKLGNDLDKIPSCKKIP